MLTNCPKCGQKTALLNNTCEHCGVKTKICTECGNIVEESQKICSYCGVGFEQLEKIQVAQDIQNNIEKDRKKCHDLVFYAFKKSKQPFEIINGILVILSFIPIFFTLFTTIGASSESIATSYSLGVTISLIIMAFVNPLEELLGYIAMFVAPNRIRKKAKELGLSKNAYFNNLVFDNVGNIVFDTAVVPKDVQLAVVDAFRTENGDGKKALKIIATIVNVFMAPILCLLFLSGILPILQSVILSSIPFLEAVFMNPALLVWLILLIPTCVLRVLCRPSLRVNSEYVKKYLEENK